MLQELKGKTADDILSEFHKNRRSFPVDIVDIASKMGIKLGSIDFTELEKEPGFKELVAERGHILGAVYNTGEYLQIVYHNALHDDAEYAGIHLSEVDRKRKLMQRQRFTIAHEIAHCCLHMEEGNLTYIEYRTEQGNPENEAEVQANIFAGELLIPIDALNEACDMFKDIISISVLADWFVVSCHVMKRRIELLQSRGYYHDKQFI